jgi:microcystin-dependent protein
VTITNIGYDGSITESSWALLQPYLGRFNAFGGATDFAPTVSPGVDRTVSLAPGSSFGSGVLVTSDAAIAVQSPVLAAGTRWDTIALRRDWQTDTSSIVVLTGSSTEQVAAGLNDQPGIIQDQPLALVQITAGTQEPTAVRDLRPNIADADRRDVGDLFVHAGPDAPFGAILAQGQELSRAQYSRLFARIGTTHGAGNGTTTFNAPNVKGRTIVGLDPANTAFDARGKTGGAQTHTLTEAELPAHVHDNGHGHAGSTTDSTGWHGHDMGHGHGRQYGSTYGGVGGHAHGMNIADGASGSGGLLRKAYSAGGDSTGAAGAHDHSAYVDVAWFAGSTGAAGAHTHAVSVSSAAGNTGSKGGGGAHNNMPPFLVEHWCVQV